MPEDLSVMIGSNDIKLAAFFRPAATTLGDRHPPGMVETALIFYSTRLANTGRFRAASRSEIDSPGESDCARVRQDRRRKR